MAAGEKTEAPAAPPDDGAAAGEPQRSGVTPAPAAALPRPPPPRPNISFPRPLGSPALPAPPGGKPPLSPLGGKLAGKVIPELSGRVVQGARRPDAPPPGPPPRDLPALPRPPAPGEPTQLPSAPAPDSPASGEAAEDEDVGLDVHVEEATTEKAEKAPSEPPRRRSHRPPQQLPAICGYGRYEILGRIAFGGMAEIFLGRENSSAGSSRLLAIKRILPHVADDAQFVEMFLDEARLAIQLAHPHICHIYEFGELEGTYFIAMEWIHGVPLGKIIRRSREQGKVQPEVIVKILAQIAEALHYAHRARDANGQPLGIVHRDVSPHNVMIAYEGQVKLLDFGIAKATSASTKTEAGVVKGKFAYMSPQQCLGKHIDARADVFALGICLYEALTGKSLYQRDTDYETMKAVIEDPVASIRDVRPELPVALDEIVKKALQKSPDDRWKSAGEMQSAMEDWLASTGKAMTNARIAEAMEELFAEEIRRGPLVDSTPFGMSFKRVPSGMSGTPGSGARAIGGEGTGSSHSSPPTAIGSGRGRAKVASGAHAGLLEGETAQAPTRSRAPLLAGLGVAALLGIGLVAWSLGGATTPEPTPPPVVVAPPPEPTPPPVVVAPPPEPTPPPDVRARVVVHVDVAGATVHIGDTELSAADAERGYAVAPGHYAIRVEHPERRTFEGAVDLEGSEEEVVEVHLEPRVVVPTRPPGRLSINTRPWSKVYVGSRLLGTTPIGEASVPSGSVRLRIVDRDGRTFSRNVAVPAGEETSVFYDLDE